MSKTRWAFVSLMMAGICLINASAFAEVINITFQGDTPGQPPGTNVVPGNPMTQPSAIGGFGSPSGTILVGSAPGMAQGVILTTDSGNAALGAQWVDVNGFSLPGQRIAMSFDVNILSAPTNATTQPKILNGGVAGILLGMNAFTNTGDPSFRFAAAPTSETGGVFAFRTPDNSELISFFNYTEGQTYHIDIVADYTTGTLDAFVNGNKLLTGFAFWTSGAPNITTGEFFFHLNGEQGFSNSVAIDNIFAGAAAAAQEVPEPASLLVWTVLGAISLGAARRRGSFSRRQ